MTVLVFVLLALDFGLIVGVVYYLKHNNNHAEVLEALTEERMTLKRVRSEIRDEMDQAKSYIDKAIVNYKRLAAEVEEETKTGKSQIQENLKEVMNEFTQSLEGPLKELSRKQNSLEGVLRLAGREKDQLLNAVRKGQILSKFFNQEIPYEQLLKDIELKKYDDARRLIGQGYSADQVAKELGIRTSEIEMIRSVTPS